MTFKNVSLALFTLLFVSACTSQRLVQPIADSSAELESGHHQLEYIMTAELRNSTLENTLQFKSLFHSDDLSRIDLLTQVLLATDNDLLLADADFYRVFDIVDDHQSEHSKSFAVALSSFIIRQDFQCIRPLYAHYFSNRYGIKISENECNTKLPIHLTSNLTTQSELNIDVNRVSAIHILFAGSGEGIVSRFGHISLRLIVCPEHDLSEDACNSNLFEHIVLGYRAHVDEFKLDPWQGLVGGYDAYLFAHDFIDTYQEYAIGEFREIYSLPLKMTQQQRNLLLRNLIDIHWGFAGDYKFLTNNCTTLLQTALLNSAPDFFVDPSLAQSYWRPDNFFKALTSSQLTESYKLEDLDLAEQEGYYFSSTLPIYQQALESVNLHLTDTGFKDIDSYINSNPEVRFNKAMTDDAYYFMLQHNSKLLSAQILLEELSIVKYQRWLAVELATYFQENDIKTISKHMKMGLSEQQFLDYKQCLLLPVLGTIKPIRRQYGIPQRVTENVDNNRCKSAKVKQNLSVVRVQLNEFSPQQWQTVERIFRYWLSSINNVDAYIEMESL